MANQGKPPPLAPSVSITTAAANLAARGKVSSMSEAQRRLAAAKISITAGDALNHPRRELSARQEVPGFGVLTIEEIKAYDKNPRVSRNPAYFEIKESLRTNGLKGTLPVTRRPGEDIYMVSSGGNSRLAILKELYDETGDKRFFEVSVTHETYVCESRLIANHLIENEVRGETTFWEKASGLMSLKDELEKEQNKPISIRGFESILAKELGLTVAASAIGYYTFAWYRLRGLGEFSAQLTRNHVKEVLQPRFSLLTDLARLFSIEEQQLQVSVIAPGVAAYAATYVEGLEFSAEDLCAQWEIKLAPLLMKPESFVRRALNLHATFGQLSSREIEQRLDDEDRRLTAMRDAQANAVLANLPGTPVATRNPAGSQDASIGGAEVHSVNTKYVTGVEAAAESNSAPSASAYQGMSHGLPQALGLDRPTQLLRYVLSQANEFAKLTQIQDLVVPEPQMPCGFFIDLPGIDSEAEQRLKRHHLGQVVWWFLAGVTGQLDSYRFKSMPKASLWRRTRLLDGYSAMESDRIVQKTVDQPPPFDLLAAILADPNHSLSGSYLSLLDGIRQLHEAAPQRFRIEQAA
jgi:hypothetical protein